MPIAALLSTDLLHSAAEPELHVVRSDAMRSKCFALTVLSLAFAYGVMEAEQDAQRSRSGSSGALTLVGRVQQVHGPRVVSVENRLAEDRRVVVVLPEGTPAPLAGSVLSVRGALGRLDEAQLANRPWTEMDQAARGSLAGHSVLVAESVETAGAADTGRLFGERLPVRAYGAARRQVTVRPAALAGLIGELAGFDVTVPYARVVGVFDSRAFLIDSAVRHQPALGERDRILVVVNDGALRVPAETLVASTVTVVGVARSILGMQAGGDAPWPAQLDRDALKRLEVRAAVLATSVHTPEGVELTDRPPAR